MRRVLLSKCTDKKLGEYLRKQEISYYFLKNYKVIYNIHITQALFMTIYIFDYFI